MRLIVDTEPSVDISTMAELKDIHIREKLVNNIMEDLNLCSPNKENIKTDTDMSEYLIRNGNIGDTEKIIAKEGLISERIEEKIKRKIVINHENSNNATNVEKNADNDSRDHKEINVESQDVSSSNNLSLSKSNYTKGQSFKELKHILNKDIEDSLIQEHHEKQNFNTPVENNIENNDIRSTIEKVENTKVFLDVGQSEPSDHENKGIRTNIAEVLDESKMDVIEIDKERDDVINLKGSDSVCTNLNVIDLAVEQIEVKHKSDEMNSIQTVIIDDKDNDSLAENDECMEIDNPEEIINEDNVKSVIACGNFSEPTVKSNSESIKESNSNIIIDCEEVSELIQNATSESVEKSIVSPITNYEEFFDPTRNSISESMKATNVNPIIDCQEVSEPNQNSISGSIKESNVNSIVEDFTEISEPTKNFISESIIGTNVSHIIDCEEDSEITPNSISESIKETNINAITNCEEVSEPTQNSNSENIKETYVNPIIDCEQVSELTQNSISESIKETNVTPIIDCEEVSEPNQNCISEIITETSVNPIIDCEEDVKLTQDIIPESIKEHNVNRIVNCEKKDSEPSRNLIAEVSTSEVMDVSKDDIVVVEEDVSKKTTDNKTKAHTPEKKELNLSTVTRNSSICRLSNNLDILSDDEEENVKENPKTDDNKETKSVETSVVDKQCINIEEDDDIMLIEDNLPEDVKKCNEEIKDTLPAMVDSIDKIGETSKIDEETGENKSTFMESIELVSSKNDNGEIFF